MLSATAFPREGIWQEIRASALDSITSQYPLTPANMYSLVEWLKAGSYSCQTATKSEFSLLVYSDDVGGALLGDAEYFLNHASEQRAAAFAAIEHRKPASDAWLLITYYYWAYFSALAITRMTGKTTWFLDSTHVALLKGAAPSGAGGGGGAYVLELESPQNATQRILRVKRSKERLHEAVWDRLYKSLAGWVDAARAQGSRTLEGRMYAALLQTAARHGRDWPSRIRNTVNYRPGAAYDAVTGSRRLRMMSFARPEPMSRVDVISEHEAAFSAAGATLDPSCNGTVCAQLLMTLCYLLNDLAASIHSELVDRLSLARSWSILRAKYDAEYLRDLSNWPFA